MMLYKRQPFKFKLVRVCGLPKCSLAITKCATVICVYRQFAKTIHLNTHPQCNAHKAFK